MVQDEKNYTPAAQQYQPAPAQPQQQYPTYGSQQQYYGYQQPQQAYPQPQAQPYYTTSIVASSAPGTLYPKLEQEHQSFLQGTSYHSAVVSSTAVHPVTKPKNTGRKVCIGFTVCTLLCCCICCVICCAGPISVASYAIVCAVGKKTLDYSVSTQQDISSYKNLKLTLNGKVSLQYSINPSNNIIIQVTKQSMSNSDLSSGETFVFDSTKSEISLQGSSAPWGGCAFTAYTVILPNNQQWLQNLNLQINSDYGDIETSIALAQNPLQINSLTISNSNGATLLDTMIVNTNAVLSTLNGAITLNGFQVDSLNANTENGAIVATNLIVQGSTRSIKAITRNGWIKFTQFNSLSKLNQVDLETQDGMITLDLPYSFSGQYSMSTVNGALKVMGKWISQKSSSGTIGAGGVNQVTMKSQTGILKLDVDQ